MLLTVGEFWNGAAILDGIEDGPEGQTWIAWVPVRWHADDYIEDVAEADDWKDVPFSAVSEADAWAAAYDAFGVDSKVEVERYEDLEILVTA